MQYYKALKTSVHSVNCYLFMKRKKTTAVFGHIWNFSEGTTLYNSDVAVHSSMSTERDAMNLFR